MLEKITLLSGDAKESIEEGQVGLLFECAPDSEIRKKYPKALAVSELIGDFDDVKDTAYYLVTQMLKDEPVIEGVQQLSVFDELVIREVQKILHAKKLHEKLVSLCVSRCVFMHDSSLISSLQVINDIRGGEIDIFTPGYKPNSTSYYSLFKRVCKRLFQSGSKVDNIIYELRLFMDRIDPFHRRSSVLQNKAIPTRRIYFYSTAYTFSRIGMVYEPYFPESFEYVVENVSASGKALKEQGRSFISIYDFNKWKIAPRKKAIDKAKVAIIEHICSVDLGSEYACLIEAYINSEGFKFFLNRLLPRGLFHTRLANSFMDAAKPKAIVVGNPVHEAYLLHSARVRNIPTLLLQHGVLGDYCQFVNPPVDHYIVRGQFWRDFLSPEAASRAHLINPPCKKDENTKKVVGNDKVLFLTAPYSHMPYCEESDLDEIIRTLMKACEALNRELIVRVHPLESVGYYQHRINNIKYPAGKGLSITYSQGEGVDNLLYQSAVAVTFSSTVFLDCLRLNVPIISFGWHHFSYKKKIQQYSVFHFCRSLAELEDMVGRALSGNLQPYEDSVEPFLSTMTEECARSHIERLLLTKPYPEGSKGAVC